MLEGNLHRNARVKRLSEVLAEAQLCPAAVGEHDLVDAPLEAAGVDPSSKISKSRLFLS